MKTVFAQLKKDIKENASEGRRIALQIEELKWKPGALAEVQAARAKKDASGRRVTGKKALKAFRRPETGLERYGLWGEKRSVGYEARMKLLAYGMLRGLPYLCIEKKCHDLNKPSAYALRSYLAIYLTKEQMALFPESAIKAWLEGGEAPKLPRDPKPEEPVKEPKVEAERPSLMQRVAAHLELLRFTWLQSSTS